MKTIIDYCVQTRRYGDSYGKCVVKLEDNETIDDVIKEYIKPKKDWFEQKYSNPKEASEYIEERYQGDIKHEGRLVIMDTHRVYLD